ncbi:MAG TPA: phosphatidate cytidylyltransferase [Candidatus Binataceae bacterium]|nr:phosphatidate cytidylyltransferase [Candidatus Binataceae bacterium]
MLRTRLLTAAVALPAVLAMLMFASGPMFSAFIAVLGLWALYEVAATTTDARDPLSLGILATAGALPLFVMLARGDGGLWIIPTAIIAAMIALVIAVAIRGPAGAPRGRALAALGALYIGVLYPYFAMLRNLRGGIPLIILMLMLVVASDSGAYFAGSAIGRTKLAPRVSPNKSVEGAIGGLAAALVAGVILRRWLAPGLSIAAAAAISISIAILAQLGDLAGSAFKRGAGVKDSGWIFPGHGGLIDRTCSLVFAAVFTYYCFK